MIYAGTKPFPKNVHIEDGFQLNFDPRDVIKDPKKAMDPFVREFSRPWDSAYSKTSAEAQKRYNEDSLRFPPKSYEVYNLVGKGDSRRVPNHRERLAMHGFPANLIDDLPALGKSKEQLAACKNSLASSGGHLMSTMLYMFILLQLAQPSEGKLARQAARFHFAPFERDLSRRTHNTVFQEGGMLHFPGLLSQHDLIEDIQEQFPSLKFPAELVERFKSAKVKIPVARLQCYWVWTQLKQREAGNQGPGWTGQRRRGIMAASLGSQRYPGSAKLGLDHIIKPGLGKSKHMQKALELESPFIVQGVCDEDVAFTACATAVLGPWLAGWRCCQAKAMTQIKKCLQPLETWMATQMPASVKLVAGSSCPVWMATMTSLLRWPDRLQASGYVFGMKIIGEIEPMGIFRHIPEAKQCNLAEQETLLGENAVKAISQLMASGPPKAHEAILAATMEEQEKGWLSSFLSKSELDAKFGIGGWRFIPRFIIHQKLRDRVIDNAKKGKQNSAASFKETIFTASVDFFGEVLAAWIAEVAWELQGVSSKEEAQKVLDALPEWFRPIFGLDDMPDAYRGVPLHPDDSNVAIVAVWDEAIKAWKFAISRSMLFGLSAAVLHFNRKPTLLVAASRRFFAVAATAFFDDIMTLALACAENSEKKAIFMLLNSVGCPHAPEKSAPNASTRTWIGISACLSEVATAGYYSLKPTESSINAVVNGCKEAIAKKHLTKDEAASLRGKASWASSHSAGRCGRIGMEVLKRKQYHGPAALTQEECRALVFLAGVSRTLPAKRVFVAGSSGPPVVIYSDASCEPEDPVPKMGWVIFRPGARPRGRASIMSSTAFGSLNERRQQIFPGEVFAAYSALFEHKEELQGKESSSSTTKRPLQL